MHFKFLYHDYFGFPMQYDSGRGLLTPMMPPGSTPVGYCRICSFIYSCCYIIVSFDQLLLYVNVAYHVYPIRVGKVIL